MDIFKNYNFTKLDIFFKLYEPFLFKVYLNSYIKYSKGLLYVDINKIIKKKSSVEYIPIKNRDEFWEQSVDIMNIKKKIIEDKKDKYYLWLIDKEISIFFERLCSIKNEEILKNELYSKNNIILFNNIKTGFLISKKFPQISKTPQNPKILFNNIKNFLSSSDKTLHISRTPINPKILFNNIKNFLLLSEKQKQEKQKQEKQKQEKQKQEQEQEKQKQEEEQEKQKQEEEEEEEFNFIINN